MSFLKEFTLSRSKKDLSPQLSTLSKLERTHLSKSIYQILDDMLMDLEGLTFSEHFTKKEQQVVFTFLSFLVHEGYSQVEQQLLAEKAGVSVPLIIQVRDKLVDLGIIQDVPVRRKGRQRANFYILVLHPNYLLITKYVQERFDVVLDIPSTFSQFFSQFFSQSKAEIPCVAKDEKHFEESNSFSCSNKKEMYKDIYEPVADLNNLSKVDQAPEVYASASGVPNKLVSELSIGLSTTQIVGVWKALTRTLHKYQAKYEMYEEIIIDAVRHSFTIYKAADPNVKARFNFAGCICGKTKEKIGAALEDKYMSNWKMWIAGQLKESHFLNSYEQATAQLLGLLRPNLSVPFNSY